MSNEPPLATLERSLIDEYLRDRGYDRAGLAALADAERASLLKDASSYASCKLSEVEMRSQFVHELHHAAEYLPASKCS
jgi:hypothetical protein